MEVGSSLHRVISYWTVRDKFKDVNPALKAIGVEKIEILDNGLLFVGNIKPIKKKKNIRGCQQQKYQRSSCH